MTDPRITDVNTSVNEAIQDRTIRHMVFLERYKASEVKKIQRVLNRDILPDLSQRIERRLQRIVDAGFDTGAATTARLQQLERELERLADNMADRLKAQTVLDLNELSIDEIDWQVNMIRDELGFDLDFIVPAAPAVANVIRSSSFAGLTIDQWFKTLSRSTQRGVMQAVNRGLVEGETVDQITRRIRGTKRLNYTDGVFETTRRQASTLSRTTINHATNQARIELFKRNEDLIHGLQWTSTLDSRTSTTCAGLDGKIFPVDSGQRPPAHPNCRSTMTPVLKDWKALGLTQPTPGQRASINGQVPASTTYGSWLKRQPINVQEEVLGVTKAKLFRDGGLAIDRFTDARLKPLNLSQLRTLEQSAFKRAKIEL